MAHNPAPRDRLIRLLHVARRDLAMAEDSYRALIVQVSGGRASSSKDLRVDELEAALTHMKRCGFRVKAGNGAASHRPLASDDQSRKIRALWLELAATGAVRDPSEAALAAFVRRHTGVEALQWLTSHQASRIIEHLKRWRLRHNPQASNA